MEGAPTTSLHLASKKNLLLFSFSFVLADNDELTLVPRVEDSNRVNLLKSPDDDSRAIVEEIFQILQSKKDKETYGDAKDNLGAEDIESRRDKLLQLLADNKLSAEAEKERISIAGGVACINSPYLSLEADLVSTNQIVLGRLRELLSDVMC